MRIQITVAAFVAACITATAEAAPAPGAPVVAGSAPTTATQWFVDTDGDGFRDDKVVGSGSIAPKGAYAASAYPPAAVDCDDTNDSVYPGATEEVANDGVDQDCDGTVETAASDAEARSLASWSLGASVVRGPNLPAYHKVYGQVVACETVAEWSVADGTCLCGSGHAWRAYQDTDGAWTGVCDAVHGASGSGGGYDHKAREAAATLRTEFEAEQAANEAVHEGLRSTDAALRYDIDDNYEADKATWKQYQEERQADRRAHDAEENKFRGEVVDVNRDQDAYIEVALTTANDAANAVVAEAEVREEADESHAATHSATILEAGFVGGSQSLMKDGDLLLRGDSYRGFGMAGAFGGRFAEYGLVMAFMRGAVISEESQIGDERVRVTGYDFGGGLELGGSFPLSHKLAVSMLARGGYAGSVTGSGATQSQVVGSGPFAGVSVYGWLGHLGPGLYFERYWEITGHSAVFSTPDQPVMAENLLEVAGEGTATNIGLNLAVRF